MVAGFTELYGVAWPLLTLGGRRNVAPLYDMCYYSFLIKKAAPGKGVDFVAVVDYHACQTVNPCAQFPSDKLTISPGGCKWKPIYKP